MRTTSEKIALAVGLLCAVTAALVPPLAAPQFREMFVSFGAELPLITKIFVQYNYVFFLLPALVLAAWLYWPKPSRRALISCLIGTISLALIVPAFVGAMYLPIFKLAAVS